MHSWACFDTCLHYVKELLKPVGEDDAIQDEADTTELLRGGSERVKDGDDEGSSPSIKEQWHAIAVLRRVAYSENVLDVFFISSLQGLRSVYDCNVV